MSKHETTIDGGAIQDLVVIAYFDYQPFEAVEYEEGRAVYPGCPEAVTLISVTTIIDKQKIEILPLLTDWDIQELETECKENR